MNPYRILILLLVSFLLVQQTSAQSDSSKNAIVKTSTAGAIADTNNLVKKDSVVKHDPRKATRRSAIIPGWGQAYNREYWKIPLVYGAIAIPTVMFIYNNNWYKKTKYAYEAKYTFETTGDTTGLAAIDPDLKNLSTTSLQSYRNSFRRDRDYSILFFLLAWGLNVVDATVFGHLKDFDVSNNLSMNLKPQFNPNTKSSGLMLTFHPKKPEKKLYEVR
ncbi:MAG: hypothetical protein CFE25_17810 [Chitinophagaceae bacterium BSSC1]|nr:MAG: hypothetical protein CFE25_17810 [Chitinophagaceae bacterium BSSC1]